MTDLEFDIMHMIQDHFSKELKARYPDQHPFEPHLQAFYHEYLLATAKVAVELAKDYEGGEDGR